MKAVYPTQKQAKARWDYDPETGIFRSKIYHGRWRAGKQVGYKNKLGYIYLKYEDGEVPAHRIAWIYVYGELPKQLDHINQDRTDNRISNLRKACRSTNGANRSKQKNNTSGFKGVVQYWRNPSRWVAQIQVNGKNYYLGIHDTKEKAHKAYLKAAKKHFGEFACG
jgi:hypothetical protein